MKVDTGINVNNMIVKHKSAMHKKQKKVAR